jgi:tetratricopeptide (TPR) repeat protein
MRQRNERALLAIKARWLPPVLAVLVCGLQITFWEHAISASGEMLDLLLFAYLIRCLLEYRVSLKDHWLFQFALVCGLATANNYAMMALCPGFVVALVWFMGWRFFNLDFLVRCFAFWLAGMSLFLLPPAIAHFRLADHPGFWDLLKFVLGQDKNILLHPQFPRALLFLLGLTSILPLLIISIKWPAYFGDTSPMGVFIANGMFHIVHGFFFCALLWLVLDAPFSPRRLGFGMTTFLPLYYLSSLCVGYIAGYFLLVFGARNLRIRKPLPESRRFMNQVVVALTWTLSLATLLLLAWKNTPRVWSGKSDAISRYARLQAASLPGDSAVVLSDDPMRLYYLQATLSRAGKAGADVPINTTLLAMDPGYLPFVVNTYPQLKSIRGLELPTPADRTPASLTALMRTISKTYPLFYLQPSYGYYLEEFYLQPRGSVYELKRYETNSLTKPPLSRAQIDEAQAFWRKTAEQEFPPLIRMIKDSAARAKKSVNHKLLYGLWENLEPDYLGLAASAYYSRAVDNWGVELERNGAYQEAAEWFTLSGELNPANVSATYNQEVNQVLRNGGKPKVINAQAFAEKFGSRVSWTQILGEYGPMDNPNYCYELGRSLSQSGLYRQAYQQFDRVETLAPNETDAWAWMAQILVISQNYPKALALTENALKRSPTNSAALFLKSVSLMQSQDFAGALVPLNKLLTIETNNYSALLNRAIANLQLNHLQAAKTDYETIREAAPKAFQVYYGLGEIAYRQRDTNEAIANYQIYLTNAPSATAEFGMISERVKELQAGKEKH